jgi:hypothetical protein
MSIELTPAQADALRHVLTTRLGNLSSEIRHTDTPRVRQELRAEREALRTLLGQLELVAA